MSLPDSTIRRRARPRHGTSVRAADILLPGSQLILSGGGSWARNDALQEIALCLAAGLPWQRWQPARPCRVLLVSPEIASPHLVHRLHAIADAHGMIIPDGLQFLDPRPHWRECDELVDGLVRLVTAARLNAIVVKALGPRGRVLAHHLANSAGVLVVLGEDHARGHPRPIGIERQAFMSRFPLIASLAAAATLARCTNEPVPAVTGLRPGGPQFVVRF